MRKRIRSGVWIAAGAALWLAGAAHSQVEARPNVVILFTDDQGTLDANCYGSADLHTPTIDALAASGVRFTQAYAHTVCCPARASLMTGRHPQRSGVNEWTQGDMRAAEKGVNMDLEEVTLAEALKAAGYNTALFGKWHLGAHEDHGPKQQGFDEFFGFRDGFIDNYRHFQLHQNGYHDLYEGTEEVFAEGKYFPEMITERAVNFIEAHKDEPFFLYVGFNIPHYPEQALEEHAKLYEHLPEPRRSYASIVTTTDHYMGIVLAKLEELGLRDNTIVIFQSDNGHSVEDYRIKGADHRSGLPEGHNYGANGGGGSTGKWTGHKGTFLEGGLRVPAIISYPDRVPKGVVRDQAITVMDWFPTVLELCDVPAPENVVLDGKSLLPVIESAEAEPPHEVLHWQWFNSWAVRRGAWKLICTRGRNANAEPRYQLYHLEDPAPEVRDYSAEEPGLVTRLKALHTAWEEEVFAGQ